MSHKPILINNLSLKLPHKTCFEDFSATIHYGNHIAIIGHNGSGKSSLLKMICKMLAPTTGEIKIPNDAIISYIPQVVEEFSNLSGGQRF